MYRQGGLMVSAAAVFFALGTIFSPYPSADARLRALPLPRQLEDCYLRTQNYTVKTYVEGLYTWYCEIALRACAAKPRSAPQYAYYRELYSRVEPSRRRGFRGKQEASRCLRKEYRMLTDDERIRFHNAVNVLKRDTTVEPNKFDALSLLHTGTLCSAHGGPGFFGWHRVYLLLFETALQEVDPRICLPYWDSTLDAALTNPVCSHLWTTDFLGSKDGDVLTGPFSDWKTPEGVKLMRSVGRDGTLFTRQIIQSIVSRNTYEEILLLPGQDPQFSLEFHHGGPHLFVGGHMGQVSTSAYDVIFFMHHAFVDYIWEMFRDKMRNNGLDPEQYPVCDGVSDYHLPNATMGFGNVTQQEGYLNSMKDSYEYLPSPECSDCGSKYLYCKVSIATCVPVDPRDPPLPIPGPHPQPLTTPTCTVPRPLANHDAFCINGVCDVSQWVWMPVKIVAQRSPEFQDHQSYPVQNGKVSSVNDIYEPSAYSDTSRNIKKTVKPPKGYEQCHVNDGIGRISMVSMGVNYDGVYKESAIIDQRLATSIGVTFIAVKDPGADGVSEVVLRAHDQCGRICRTVCKIPDSNPARYEGCSGVLEVTSQSPRQYSPTYARATLDVYDYASNSDCPSFNSDDIFLTFYCDYRDHIPWVDKPTKPRPERPVPTLPATRPTGDRLSPKRIL